MQFPITSFTDKPEFKAFQKNEDLKGKLELKFKDAQGQERMIALSNDPNTARTIAVMDSDANNYVLIPSKPAKMKDGADTQYGSKVYEQPTGVSIFKLRKDPVDLKDMKAGDKFGEGTYYDLDEKVDSDGDRNKTNDKNLYVNKDGKQFEFVREFIADGKTNSHLSLGIDGKTTTAYQFDGADPTNPQESRSKYKPELHNPEAKP